MKQFLKYLKTKPLIIAYYIFVITMITTFNIVAYNQIDDNIVLIAILSFINAIILPVALYQPYQEWKTFYKNK